MATKTSTTAKKSTKPRAPTLKQLVVRVQRIQGEINDLVTILRRLDREKLVITSKLSGQPKNILPL